MRQLAIPRLARKQLRLRTEEKLHDRFDAGAIHKQNNLFSEAGLAEEPASAVFLLGHQMPDGRIHAGVSENGNEKINDITI
ncbi:hypothetical protein [Chlorobaculum sp. 24CR]|uniref:hypothetical protein n=1 Tax=Chlorobaculum sp. 24CR TaxID=2508878 RepID=UPI0014316915|nr:hypothetical protein [Chlorobaculum sp. 24CR]